MVSNHPQDLDSEVLSTTGQKGPQHKENKMKNLLTSPVELPLAHTLIRGGAASGKSRVLHHIIREAAQDVENGDAELYLIDASITEHYFYTHSTPIQSQADDTEGAISVLKAVHERLTKRWAERNEKHNTIVLLIDELKSLIMLLEGGLEQPAHPEPLKQLIDILVMGRASGIFIVATTGGEGNRRTDVLARKFPTVLTMQGGDAIVRTPDGRTRPAHFPYLDDEELAALVRRHWKDKAA